MILDGNGDFTRLMGLRVSRMQPGVNMRSWRYSMLVNDGVIETMFIEPGVCDNPAGVGGRHGFGAETMLADLREPGRTSAAASAGRPS